MYTDSHLHFDTFVEAGEVGAILDRAAAAQVNRMVAIGGSDEGNARALALAATYPDRIRAAVAYDRGVASAAPDPAPLHASWSREEVCAVGETGLDYHYGADEAEVQRELFAAMLAGARAHRLPVVVHSRDADDDTLALLDDHRGRWTGDPARIGVLHCFTRSREFAEALIERDFCISFSGIVTFKRSDALRDVAARVPEDRLLIETDSPYLAPMPNRGKRNEPAWVTHVADTIAEVRGSSPEHVAEITTQNAERLFGWPGNHGVAI